MKKGIITLAPTEQQLEKELKRTQRNHRRRAAFRSTVSVLLVITAIAILAASLWIPIYRITGDAMEPLLERGQTVLAYRTSKLSPGDVAAFYYENQILIKRVIGVSGDWIDIDEQGRVSVNGTLLEEEYLTDAVLNPTDLTYPYQVPDGCYFVMGDHRASSTDSRISAIGCMSQEKIAGKIIFRIWPLQRLEYIG